MRKILQSLGLVDDKSSQDSTSKNDKKSQNKPTITFEYKLDERSCVGKDFQRGKVFVERVIANRRCLVSNTSHIVFKTRSLIYTYVHSII